MPEAQLIQTIESVAQFIFPAEIDTNQFSHRIANKPIGRISLNDWGRYGQLSAQEAQHNHQDAQHDQHDNQNQQNQHDIYQPLICVTVGDFL